MDTYSVVQTVFKESLVADGALHLGRIFPLAQLKEAAHSPMQQTTDSIDLHGFAQGIDLCMIGKEG